ncbi:MAG: DUF4097 family beta strand repeat protein [Treponema sp.]|nr:DUF4097 family beta strand repeat protein [Treponema sp.]
MTRLQYLKAIKNNIQSLTIDEQNEALQYYSDYFDDAGDDKKVMEELGSPEEVAKQIIDKFANVPVASAKKEEKQEEESAGSYSESDSIFFSFDPKKVKNIDFGFGISEVVMIPGSKVTVECRGFNAENFECRIDDNGTLYCRNVRKLNLFNFWEHGKRQRIVPRVLITVPDGFSVGYLKLSMGAGNFTTKNIHMSCERGRLEVSAGNLSIDRMAGKDMFLRCGMGNLTFAGTLEGKTNIDCAMGNIKLNLTQDPELCSYDAKVGLGTFKFNDMEKTGAGGFSNSSAKPNHFSVNTGMGVVHIKTN